MSLPNTKRPVDPDTVALTSVKWGTTEILDDPVDFVRDGEGQYSLALATVDLDPGTYTLTVTHADGPQKVTIVTNSFVLQPT